MSGDRVKLSGGPPQTVTSVYFSTEGELRVEMYDFSPAAQEHFGNDVAYVVVLPVASVDRVAGLLGVSAEPPGERRTRTLDAIAARFESYFDVKEWLVAESITFTTTFVPWV